MPLIKVRFECLVSACKGKRALESLGALITKIEAGGYWDQKKTEDPVFATSPVEVEALYSQYIRAKVDGKTISLVPPSSPTMYNRPRIYIYADIPNITVERY